MTPEPTAPEAVVSVALVRRLKASAEAVFAAWTEPKLIARWLQPGASVVTSVTNDLRKGGRYRIDGLDDGGVDYCISGTYLDLDVGKRVAFTWTYEGAAVALRGGATVVVAELRALNADTTELTLTHEKLSKRREADLYREAWTSCVDQLCDLLDAHTSPVQSIVRPANGAETFYGENHRAWQDHFETRRLADRLKDANVKRQIGAADAAFLAHQNMFFLATVDANGQPNCSYKGGARGFVKVIDEKTLAFPNYDGNGMYLSVGNMTDNARVSLLFVDFERQARLRILGSASVRANDKLLDAYPGADLVVRIKVTALFANCPRYMHKMRLLEELSFVPSPHGEAPAAAWKSLSEFADVLREEDRHLAGDETDTAAALNRD